MTRRSILIFSFLSSIFLNYHTHAQERTSLNALAEEYLTKSKTPGIAISVIKNDTIIYGLAGVKRKGFEDKITMESKFHIGSCTKAIVASTAAKLVEEDKVRWESTLLELLPELEGKIRKEYLQITLENLLSHRAYICPFDDTFSKEWRNMPKSIIHSENVLFEFSKYILNLKPVTLSEGNGAGAHRYSNAGYSIAALMLERCSGLSWETLVKDYCKAHGAECYIGFPNHLDEGDTYGHVKKFFKMKPTNSDLAAKELTMIGPAGNVSVDILNISKIIQNNLTGLQGNDNVLKADSYQKLHFGLETYSLGWSSIGVIEKYNAKYSAHMGSSGTFFATVMLIPKLDVAVVILTNAGEPKNNENEVDILKTLWKSYATYTELTQDQ